MTLSKRKVGHRYRLPNNNAPQLMRRIALCVPDDSEYLAIFWGHMAKLGSWLYWEWDEQHRAKDIARYWNDLIIKNKLVADNTGWCMPSGAVE